MSNLPEGYVSLVPLILGLLMLLFWLYHLCSIRITHTNDGQPEYRIRVGLTHYVFRQAGVYRVENLFVTDDYVLINDRLSRHIINLICTKFPPSVPGRVMTKRWFRTVWSDTLRPYEL